MGQVWFYNCHMISGWWFGTWISFFHILGISIPTDFHIFQRGWSHQQDIVFPCFPTIHRISFQTYGSCDKPLGWSDGVLVPCSDTLQGTETCQDLTKPAEEKPGFWIAISCFYMYSICILYVFYMYSICILYVLYGWRQGIVRIRKSG